MNILVWAGAKQRQNATVYITQTTDRDGEQMEREKKKSRVTEWKLLLWFLHHNIRLWQRTNSCCCFHCSYAVVVVRAVSISLISVVAFVPSLLSQTSNRGSSTPLTQQTTNQSIFWEICWILYLNLWKLLLIFQYCDVEKPILNIYGYFTFDNEKEKKMSFDSLFKHRKRSQIEYNNLKCSTFQVFDSVHLYDSTYRI